MQGRFNISMPQHLETVSMGTPLKSVIVVAKY